MPTNREADPARAVRRRRTNGTGATSPASRRTPEYFIMEIRAAWQKSQEGVLKMGALLAEAYQELDAAGYKTVLEELKLSRTTASKLRTVAASDTLRDRSYMNALPTSWGTLYQLALLEKESRADLLGGIEDGTINPNLEQKQAEAFVEKAKSASQQARAVRHEPTRNEGSSGAHAWMQHDEVDHQGDVDDLEALIDEVADLINPLRARIAAIRNDGHSDAKAALADALREHAATANRLADDLTPGEVDA
jgi:hypothetical protein